MDPIAVIRGRIIHGKGLGRTVGMPTANLAPERGSEIPQQGVYAAIVQLREGTFIGVTNIGERPTVDSDGRFTIETNIKDFDRDIYGEIMTLSLMYYLRPTVKMKSLEEVRNQVFRDMERAEELLQGKAKDSRSCP